MTLVAGQNLTWTFRSFWEGTEQLCWGFMLGLRKVIWVDIGGRSRSGTRQTENGRKRDSRARRWEVDAINCIKKAGKRQCKFRACLEMLSTMEGDSLGSSFAPF